MKVPVEIGRDQARRLAERELDKPVYQANEPSELERRIEQVIELIADLLLRADDTTVSGWFGLVIVAALVVLVIVLVRHRAGALQRTRRRTDAALLDATAAVTAAEQRVRARRHAEAEEWAEAVRARMRAIALGLEERALLDRRPGRTADEIAREAAASLPGHTGELHQAARIFDDVWYGGRAADREAYDRITRVDERIHDAKPSFARATG